MVVTTDYLGSTGRVTPRDQDFQLMIDNQSLKTRVEITKSLNLNKSF